MELKVIKPFNGKAEGKTLQPGQIIHSTDVERINQLVGRGFCTIVSLGETTPAIAPELPEEATNVSVDFQGKKYHIETVKAALGIIGVRVAHNAKEKAVNNALSSLSDEQVQSLVEALDNNDTSDPNPTAD